ncbi:MAG: hypothetical protein M1813_001781 [Trichoglossum hirsutum]|nr:MAG: hypothetical protein M1813_001781 [Trichoglossum hirsutum]
MPTSFPLMPETGCAKKTKFCLGGPGPAKGITPHVKEWSLQAGGVKSTETDMYGQVAAVLDPYTVDCGDPEE